MSIEVSQLSSLDTLQSTDLFFITRPGVDNYSATPNQIVNNADGSIIVSITGSIKVSLNVANPNVWTGQQAFAQAVLTDASTIAWNANTQQAALVVLGGNRTLGMPTNLEAGASYTLIVKQDSTGSRTLGFASGYKWSGGVPPTLTTAANATDIFTFLSDGTSMFGAMSPGFA